MNISGIEIPLVMHSIFFIKNSNIWSNIVTGYSRIVLALASFYYMPTDYVKASFCYLLSGFLDALDGHAARLLNQVNPVLG